MRFAPAWGPRPSPPLSLLMGPVYSPLAWPSMENPDWTARREALTSGWCSMVTEPDTARRSIRRNEEVEAYGDDVDEQYLPGRRLPGPGSGPVGKLRLRLRRGQCVTASAVGGR